MCNVVKIYTADDVAILLRVDYKTVLNLVRRGKLHALPGLRHKRFTEVELKRYLGLADNAVLPEPSALHRPGSPVEAPSLAASAQTKAPAAFPRVSATNGNTQPCRNRK